MKRVFFYAAGLFLSITGYAQSGNMSERDNLIKTHNAVTKAAHENPQTLDWSGFVKAHYANDAVLMPPNAPMVKGQEAIVAMFQSWPALTKFQTDDLEVEISGNLGFIRGTYDIAMKMDNGTEMKDNGKYIEIWKKNEKSEWKCIRDIFNTDMPASH